MSKEISRRSFVKAGATGAALTGVGAMGAFSFGNWFDKAHAAEEVEEQIAYTHHQSHCGGSCSLKCTTRNGRLCLIEPNDNRADKRHQVLCLKGLSEIQHVYSIERIQTPMKRVGERGKGEFISITWDEAIDIIATNVKELWAKYGKNSILARISGEPSLPLIIALLGAQNGGKNGQDVGTGNGLDPSFGAVPGSMVGVNFAVATNEPRDWVNSKTFLNFSCNFLESSLAQSSQFFDAKDAGCNIITVDPHFSTTAAKSDTWVPINPGTDAALLLGMITYILEKGWYKEDYMKVNTSYPFLVKVSDGSFLRDHAVNATATPAETGADNPFFIWDAASDSAKSYLASGVQPALDGEFTINGEKYSTVFSLLKENQKQYTLDWASGITGIDVDTIIAITKQYATAGPAALGFGWGGSDKFTNADIAGHAGAVLVGLTGNIGIKGGSVGGGVGWWAAPTLTFGAWPLPAEIVASKAEVDIYEVTTKPNNIHAYFSFGDKLTQEIGNFNKKAEWLKSLDFIVYSDIYYSSGSDWADIILPTTTRFEATAEIQNIRGANGLLQTQEKIIDPLFDSKTDFDIQDVIGKALGYEEYLPKTPEELIRAQLDKSKDPQVKGITYEMLLASNGGVELAGIEEPRRAFTDQVFNTTSKKLEVYHEKLLKFSQQLPNFEQPIEANPDNEKRAEYPLQLCNARTRFHIHNQFCDATWITQYYEPALELNTVDLKARNLKIGDIVEVYNDRGNFSVPVKVNESVRPGSARMVEGNWTKYLKSGNLQNVTNDATTPRGLTFPGGSPVPFNDTLVEVRKAGA